MPALESRFARNPGEKNDLALELAIDLDNAALSIPQRDAKFFQLSNSLFHPFSEGPRGSHQLEASEFCRFTIRELQQVSLLQLDEAVARPHVKNDSPDQGNHSVCFSSRKDLSAHG
jgi:hypothetical protein